MPSKEMMQASLSRLMGATQQVLEKKHDMKTIVRMDDSV
jgi:hypothetical protein